MEAITPGNKITAAMITPTKDCGNPGVSLMIVSIGVESSFAEINTDYSKTNQ